MTHVRAAAGADQICVFDQGKLVQQGTHDALIGVEGVYKDLNAGQDALAGESLGGERSSGVVTADAEDPLPGRPTSSSSVSVKQLSTDSSEGSPKKGDKEGDGKGNDKEGEEEEEKFWTYGDIYRLLGGPWYLIIGSLAAIVAGVAMPAWSLFFADITRAFYMCEPWQPAAFANETAANTDLQTALDERESTIDFAVYGQDTVWGMEDPFGFGVYTDYQLCLDEQTKKCNFAALCFLLLGIGLFFAEYFKNMSYEAMKQVAAMTLRRDLFRSIVWKEIGFFDDAANTSGALTSRLAADTALVSGVLGPQMGSAFQSVTTLAVGMVIAFTASWRLALVVLGFMPLLVASASVQNKIFMGMSGAVQESTAKANHLASESIQGIRTVRAFGIEDEVRGPAGRYFACERIC
jgi:ABC-type multidrug transport system fused ATPase/permease subunit